MSPREHTDTSFVLVAGDLHADGREGLTDLSGMNGTTEPGGDDDTDP